MTSSDERLCVARVLTGAGRGLRVEWAPEEGPLTIGRDPDECALHIPDEHVSARHAEISCQDATLFVRDLGSTNGTRLYGARATVSIGEGTSVQDGDRISVGDIETPIIIELYTSLDAESAAEEERVVASTHIGRLDDLEGSLSSDLQTLRELYQGLKRFNRLRDLASVVEAGLQVLFDMLPPATHITAFLESEQPSGEREEPRLIPVICLRRDGQTEPPRPASRWLKKKVFDTRTAFLAGDASEALEGSSSLQKAAIDSMIAVPLWIGDRITGIIQVDRRSDAAAKGIGKTRPFSENDLERCVVIASQLALAIDHARLYQRLLLREKELEGENTFLKTKDGSVEMIGESDGIEAVRKLIQKVKNTGVPVCIYGETGTGKELVARTIHYSSRRAGRLLVTQNCAALPEELLESELFGHVKGAFTGADSDKKGLFEIADGGTIFLDEVGETTPAMQAKLLRVLQEGEFRPVGAVRNKQVDVRVISATNRNLEEEVSEGRFREDLYYRLNVFPIHLPPLRDRTEDIPLLADHFMRTYAVEFDRIPMSFSPAALDLLTAYKWPGNIRELQNEIQRIIIVGTNGDFVLPEDLSARVRTVDKVLQNAGDDPAATLKARMNKVERYLLIEALREHDNNKTQTAKTLGITREGLHKKLKRFGIG